MRIARCTFKSHLIGWLYFVLMISVSSLIFKKITGLKMPVLHFPFKKLYFFAETKLHFLYLLCPKFKLISKLATTNDSSSLTCPNWQFFRINE